MTGFSRWAEIKLPPRSAEGGTGMIPSTSTAARVTVSDGRVPAGETIRLSRWAVRAPIRCNIMSGDGDDHIEQYGGSGNNLMHVNPDVGDDVIKMYGGPGNNSMTYDVGSGNDVATILGGGGYNTLTINKNHQNFTLKDYQGKVLFQSGSGGSTITVANLQRITVLDDAGKPIYTYNAGTVPSIMAPLLLGD